MGKIEINCRTGEITSSSNFSNYFTDGEERLYAFYAYNNFIGTGYDLKAIIFGNFLFNLRKEFIKTSDKELFIHVYARADGSFNLQLGQNIRVNFFIAIRTFSIKIEKIIMHRSEDKYIQNLIEEQQKNIYILKTLTKTIDSWKFPKNMKVPEAYKDKYDKFIKKK
jgi:hypothetical protein